MARSTDRPPGLRSELPTYGRHHHKPPGTLPPAQSFFSTQEDNVVITAIKKDEDDNSLIVRFYEWAGKKGDVHLTLPQAALSGMANELDGSSPVARSRLTSTGKVVTVPTNAIRDQDGESAVRKVR